MSPHILAGIITSPQSLQADYDFEMNPCFLEKLLGSLFIKSVQGTTSGLWDKQGLLVALVVLPATARSHFIIFERQSEEVMNLILRVFNPALRALSITRPITLGDALFTERMEALPNYHFLISPQAYCAH